MKTATSEKNYSCSITANGSATGALDKISRVDEWWAQNFEGSAKNLGDIFTVRFGTTWVMFKTSEFISGKKVAWQVMDCYLPWLNDKTEWNGTTVVFEVLEKDNAVEIDMTHIGLAPESECYDDCEKGWEEHIKESLFKLLTEEK